MAPHLTTTRQDLQVGLASVVRGHMAYYAVPGNYEAWRPSATR